MLEGSVTSLHKCYDKNFVQSYFSLFQSVKTVNLFNLVLFNPKYFFRILSFLRMNFSKTDLSQPLLSIKKSL